MSTLNANLPFLDASELVSIASNADAISTRTLKALDRLQKDVDARKREIANRWKTAPIAPMDKQRIEAEEIRVATMQIRQNAEKELDGLFSEAGAAYNRAVAQRPFYDSAVKTLNRLTLGDPKRSEYMRQLRSVGPAELAHLGQFAVSSGNKALAAAIVSRLDSFPASSRPFGAVELASAMNLDEHRKASEAIKIVEVRFQTTVIAIRTWKAGKSNPLNTVSLALQGRALNAALMSELEADDAAR
jgi:hypothetical protein